MAAAVVVTGASGFLGSHVCDVLLERGLAVRAAHRASSNLRWLKDKDLATVSVDLARPDEARPSWTVAGPWSTAPAW
ncbi:MAG: NAD-dependent epimerase/dehydratase family protein [Candidatus Krumholzibacteriia bacterium]